ncbi:MAG: GDP-mannose 4,6-dehydratase [Candidatus Bathyarchaeia archaeon]
MAGRFLITGGAVFIGSHLVDAFMKQGFNVSVLDNLSSGSLENTEQWFDSSNFTFTKGDLLASEDITRQWKTVTYSFKTIIKAIA